ncbi:MAG: hypothetical protein K2L96_07015 [Muribaculaceae bacterium]|nr:hypothetical protein [Muribaculaceae bacterium]
MSSITIKNTLLAPLGLALLLGASTQGAQAYPMSYYKSSSVLAAGHWVKISVEGEGIFQVSYDELKAWGFDDPSKVTVYGYSPLADVSGAFTTTHVDDLPQTASMHTEDGRLLFYGESDAKISPLYNEMWEITRNHYDRQGVYFLTDSQPAKKIPTTAYRVTATSAGYLSYNTHVSLQFIENEAQNPMSAGIYYHDTPMAPGESRDFTFRVKNFDTSGSSVLDMTKGYFLYYFYMNTNKAEALESNVSDNVKLTYRQNGMCSANTNSNWIYSTPADGMLQFQKPDGVSDALKDEDVTLTITRPATSTATYAAIDKVLFSYPRKSSLGDDRQLIMHYFSGKELQRVIIRDTPLDAVAWNVDNPMDIKQYEVRRNDDIEQGRMTLSLSRLYSSKTDPCRIVVFTPSAMHASVTYCGDVENSNIHGDKTPEMVIITTKTLINEARALAAIHEKHQGIRVKVYTQEEVFNEFSSGVRNPMAYRRMAKMFYDREPDVFKYMLLYGTGSWDNRNITLATDDRLLTFQTEVEEHARDAHRCYTSDQYFGMLKDNFNPQQVHYTESDIAVGRMTVSTPTQAQSANEKIERFMQNPPSAANYMRMVIGSDRGDSNAHYQQGEQVASVFEELLEGSTVTRAHVADYPVTNGMTDAHTILMEALKNGQGFLGYCGHGGPTGVTGTKLLNQAQIGNELYDVPVFAHFSSCDLFCFDRQSSLMDAMLALPRGGLIGGVGASRSVYLEYNQPLYLAVCRQYALAQPGMSYGQVFQKARNEVVNSKDTTIAAATNTLCYNFLGDPAVPMPVPRYEMEVETIDGVAYNKDAKIDLLPLSKVSITGKLVRKDGLSGEGFSGDGLLEVYETPRSGNKQTVSNPDYKAGNGQPQYLGVYSKLDHQQAAESSFEIKGGRFEAQIVLPELGNYGDLNRMVLTGTDSTTGEMAATALTNIRFAAPGEDFESTLSDEAPEILSMYIGTPDFRPEDATTSDFTIYAEVRIPESGLNRANGGLVSPGAWLLDSKKGYSNIFTGANYTDQGTVILSREFTGLTDGKHSLKLTVENNMGGQAEAELSFCVMGSDIKAELSCTDSANGLECKGDIPVREGAVFAMSHDSDAEPSGRLLVFDSLGNTVLSKENVSFPFTWNLQDMSGAAVADGLYRAKVMLKSGTVFGGSPEVEFMVLK